MDNATTNWARNIVLNSLRSAEQTEDYLFATAELSGIPAHVMNEAIAQLISEGRVVETTLETPAWPWGEGTVDTLKLAA